MRLRSCSKASVSVGTEVWTGGETGVAPGGVLECCFAATEAGTKDIIEVAGFFGPGFAPDCPALEFAG